MLQAIALRAIVICLTTGLVGAPSQAESYLSEASVSFGHHLPDSKDATFYRSWATPTRDAPQNLGAGQWILETDDKTRLAYPRLVALTNGASVARANGALEAMHGRILKTAYQTESFVRHSRFGELDARFGDFAVRLWTVKMTYLSPRTVSLVAIGEEDTGGNDGRVLVRGAAVDVQRGTISTINACREDLSRPFFTFGPLLTICDDRRLEAFRTLWREQAHLVQKEARLVPREWPWQNKAQEDCRPMTAAYINEMSLFSLYLTPAGLAVHNAFSSGGWVNWCFTDPQSPFFPVVIPWQKLAPLLNAGPLRDELLAPH